MSSSKSHSSLFLVKNVEMKCAISIDLCATNAVLLFPMCGEIVTLSVCCLFKIFIHFIKIWFILRCDGNNITFSTSCVDFAVVFVLFFWWWSVEAESFLFRLYYFHLYPNIFWKTQTFFSKISSHIFPFYFVFSSFLYIFFISWLFYNVTFFWRVNIKKYFKVHKSKKNIWKKLCDINFSTVLGFLGFLNIIVLKNAEVMLQERRWLIEYATLHYICILCSLLLSCCNLFFPHYFSFWKDYVVYSLL